MTSSSPPRPALMGKCVLLVDDDRHTAKLVSVLLRPEGCDVQQTQDAAGALLLLLAGLAVGVVVVDLLLPDMNGLDLVRTLRAWTRTRDLPIVAISASGPEYSQAAALAAGCNGFISKPIDPDTFVAALVAQVAQVGQVGQRSS
jgi:two-component system cell cycle response regulator DivK